ncbi:periphilin-1 isoform X2 [Haplochromis burtoni]|uniref:Periphilin-1-like n=1 Tax=Haplochromis burtoni TaxID=8153 RepID=A0A3Q2VCC7_HAPBU|nr:periphilin-1 isoform X2 [Haplochromis burtoni]
MDQARPQTTQESKGSVSQRYKEHSDDSTDKRATDNTVSLAKDEKRAIRRVRSPSRPRAWLSTSYKPKFAGRFHKPRFTRDDHAFHKAGFGTQRHHHTSHWAYVHRRDHFHSKLHHIPLKERVRLKEREKEKYKRRDSTEGSSSPKQENTTRPFTSRSSSSRDKDMQFTSNRNQSRERDHKGTKSKERSGERELPSTVSQTAARDRAIQQKRKEIDEVYYQECEMFGFVVKMLIKKDPSLERPIQSSLQQNLRDIGKRCVEAMEKFIEDYDSRELSH